MKIRSAHFAWPLLAVAAVACTMADETDADAESDAETPAAEVPETVSPEMMSDWDVTLDQDDADASGFEMVTEENGFAVRTGPAGVAWRAADFVAEGDFTASATFTEQNAPAGHREAYGIIVGGRNLADPDQQYTYFLVRGDGSYLIKRRDGDETSDLVGWTPNDAVQGIEEEGAESPNELSVAARGDQVEFSVNGSVVETLPASEVRPWGFTGIRVNHNLDVRVEDWNVDGATGQMDPMDGEEGDAMEGDTMDGGEGAV